MANKTLSGEIQVIAESTFDDKLQSNMQGIITNNYTGTDLVDIKNTNGEIINYVQCLGDNSIGNNVVVTFINNDETNPVAISDNNGLKELIGNIIDYIEG